MSGKGVDCTNQPFDYLDSGVGIMENGENEEHYAIWKVILFYSNRREVQNEWRVFLCLFLSHIVVHEGGLLGTFRPRQTWLFRCTFLLCFLCGYCPPFNRFDSCLLSIPLMFLRDWLPSIGCFQWHFSMMGGGRYWRDIVVSSVASERACLGCGNTCCDSCKIAPRQLGKCQTRQQTEVW